jgi:tetratricopeptide (TPR) repeat protein
VSFSAAFAEASSRPTDSAALEQLAGSAVENGEEERALPLLARAVETSPTARLWQGKAFLERSLDEHELALASYAAAAQLAPDNVRIARDRAETTLEAGLDARPLYEEALTLAPGNGLLRIGMAKARAAAGEGDRAMAELEALLEQAPVWTVGHEQLAQLKATQGKAAEATSSLERALERFPGAQPLWETLLYVQLRRGAYESLSDILGRARAAGVNSPEFRIYDAIHAAEFEAETHPAALFDPGHPEIEAALGRWRVRHLLRVGALDEALRLIDVQLRRDQTAELYAYAATAWRLAGDLRSEWLESNELVSVIDLSDDLPPLDVLGQTLRSLHVAKGEYLNESVRGGTQTDGPLFSRIDPVIRRLRKASVGAVEKYVSALPPADGDHPLLRERRDRRARFSGSWSVRLRSGGRHSNHVHPQGWISSALYVALPPKSEGEADDAGWFTLGEPDQRLGLKLGPWRKIEPRPAQLVLFPSWMWHGTVPFAEGERLTVAFDVAPPV